jgi:hypothetical protein
MGSACSTYGGEERCVEEFSGKTCGKESRGITRRRWEDNIKINI